MQGKSVSEIAHDIVSVRPETDDDGSCSVAADDSLEWPLLGKDIVLTEPRLERAISRRASLYARLGRWQREGRRHYLDVRIAHSRRLRGFIL